MLSDFYGIFSCVHNTGSNHRSILKHSNHTIDYNLLWTFPMLLQKSFELYGMLEDHENEWL